MQRERALDTDAERLLSDREGLPRTAALALDDDALEDLRPAADALDDLEVDLHAVTGLEPWNPPQLRALEAFDYSAHRKRGATTAEAVGRAQAPMVAKDPPSSGARLGVRHPARRTPRHAVGPAPRSALRACRQAAISA